MISQGRTLPYVLQVGARDGGEPAQTAFASLTLFLLKSSLQGRLAFAQPSLETTLAIPEVALLLNSFLKPTSGMEDGCAGRGGG